MPSQSLAIPRRSRKWRDQRRCLARLRGSTEHLPQTEGVDGQKSERVSERRMEQWRLGIVESSETEAAILGRSCSSVRPVAVCFGQRKHSEPPECLRRSMLLGRRARVRDLVRGGPCSPGLRTCASSFAARDRGDAGRPCLSEAVTSMSRTGSRSGGAPKARRSAVSRSKRSKASTVANLQKQLHKLGGATITTPAGAPAPPAVCRAASGSDHHSTRHGRRNPHCAVSSKLPRSPVSPFSPC
jgi:hypothetical protein